MRYKLATSEARANTLAGEGYRIISGTAAMCTDSGGCLNFSVWMEKVPARHALSPEETARFFQQEEKGLAVLALVLADLPTKVTMEAAADILRDALEGRR